MTRRDWWTIATIVAAAFVIRAVVVVVIERDGWVLNDAFIYHETAAALVRGEGYTPPYGGPTAQWPPGYAFVLAALYWVVGIRPLAGELLNALFGAAAVLLVYVLARRVFDRQVATIAAVIMALLPGPILWADVLVSETFFTMVFVGFLVLLAWSRPTIWWAAAAGGYLGLAALVRGEALTWGLLPLVLWWSVIPKRDLAVRAVAVGLVAVLAIAPWTIRNAREMGAFVPIATNASATLWVGHNPAATGAQVYPEEGFYDQFGFEQPSRELDSTSYLRREAIDYMVRNPGNELRLIPLKLLALNRGDSYALEWVNVQPVGAPIGHVNAERIATVADLSYFALLTTTLLGAVVLGRSLWRRPMMKVVLASFVTAAFLYGFLYYGNYRYRVPYTPLMVLVSAAFLAAIWRRRRELARSLRAG